MPALVTIDLRTGKSQAMFYKDGKLAYSETGNASHPFVKAAQPEPMDPECHAGTSPRMG